MKSLDGAELTGFIKEQQAHQVRALRQAYSIFPRLAIAPDDELRKLCQDYGQDILVEVDTTDQDQATQLAEAKATAVNWLLAAYNVNLAGKVMLLVGQQSSLDDLVANWTADGCEVLQTDSQTAGDQPVDILIAPQVNDAQPVNEKAVAIETSGQGFLELMVCVLFDNVIRAARAKIKA